MPVYCAFVILAFSLMALTATRVVVTLHALKLGAQPLTVGMLAAAFSLFPLFLSLRAGRVIDRVGSGPPILVSTMGSVCVLTLPFMVASLPALFVVAAVTGLTFMICNLSCQSLIGSLSTPADRTRNFNNAALSVALSTAVGPLLAGLSIDFWGHAATFLCIAGSLSVPVGVVIAWWKRFPGGRRDEKLPGAGLRLLKDGRVWPLLVASCLSQSGLDVFLFYVPVYGDWLGWSASQIGMVLAMAAAGGFAARILLTRLVQRSGEVTVLARALFLAAGCIAFAPLLQSPVALGVVALVFGFGMNCTQPITISLLYDRSPRGRSGETLGWRFTIDNAARLVSPGAFGAVATVLGLSAVFWINALVIGCGGWFARKGSDKGDRQANGA